jgi:hypothetical protein
MKLVFFLVFLSTANAFRRSQIGPRLQLDTAKLSNADIFDEVFRRSNLAIVLAVATPAYVLLYGLRSDHQEFLSDLQEFGSDLQEFGRAQEETTKALKATTSRVDFIIFFVAGIIVLSTAGASVVAVLEYLNVKP